MTTESQDDKSSEGQQRQRQPSDRPPRDGSSSRHSRRSRRNRPRSGSDEEGRTSEQPKRASNNPARTQDRSRGRRKRSEEGSADDTEVKESKPANISSSGGSSSGRRSNARSARPTEPRSRSGSGEGGERRAPSRSDAVSGGNGNGRTRSTKSTKEHPDRRSTSRKNTEDRSHSKSGSRPTSTSESASRRSHAIDSTARPSTSTTDLLLRDGAMIVQKDFQERTKRLDYSDVQLRDRKPIVLDFALVDWPGFSNASAKQGSSKSNELNAELKTSSLHRSERLRRRHQENPRPGSTRRIGEDADGDAAPEEANKGRPAPKTRLMSRRHSMQSKTDLSPDTSNPTTAPEPNVIHRRTQRRSSMDNHYASRDFKKGGPKHRSKAVDAKVVTRYGSLRALPTPMERDNVSLAIAASSTSLSTGRTPPQPTVSGMRRLERRQSSDKKSLAPLASAETLLSVNMKKHGSFKW